MDEILGLLSYLLLELPARAIQAFPETPLVVLVVIIVGAIVILNLGAGGNKRGRHRRAERRRAKKRER